MPCEKCKISGCTTHPRFKPYLRVSPAFASWVCPKRVHSNTKQCDPASAFHGSERCGLYALYTCGRAGVLSRGNAQVSSDKSRSMALFTSCYRARCGNREACLPSGLGVIRVPYSCRGFPRDNARRRVRKPRLHACSHATPGGSAIQSLGVCRDAPCCTLPHVLPNRRRLPLRRGLRARVSVQGVWLKRSICCPAYGPTRRIERRGLYP